MAESNEDLARFCYQSSAKIRGIAYLIEQLGSSNSPPEHPDEVFYGISLILEEQSKKIKTIANSLEGTTD